MSRKIIGITVGTQLPKPNFNQTDPTKGDYIRGDIVAAIPTDTTLTQDGHVADAKAVGDALSEKQPIGDYALQSDLDDVAALVGDTEVAIQISSAVEAVTVDSIGAAAADHDHDNYALKSEISALGSLATKDVVSKSDLESDIQASLNKADTALQSYTETDPTVPSWAKATTKPTYTASEVGAATIEDVRPITDEEIDTIFASAGLVLPNAEEVAF